MLASSANGHSLWLRSASRELAYDSLSRNRDDSDQSDDSSEEDLDVCSRTAEDDSFDEAQDLSSIRWDALQQATLLGEEAREWARAELKVIRQAKQKVMQKMEECEKEGELGAGGTISFECKEAMAEWEELVSGVTPVKFLQFVQALSASYGQRSLKNLLEDLALPVDLRHATDIIREQCGNTKFRVCGWQPVNEDWMQILQDRRSLRKLDKYSRRSAFRRRTGMFTWLWLVLTRGRTAKVYRVDFAYTPARALFNSSNEAEALMLRTLADCGADSDVFCTVLGNALLTQVWHKVESRFYFTLFVDIATIVMLMRTGHYLRRMQNPPNWLMICLLIFSFLGVSDVIFKSLMTLYLFRQSLAHGIGKLFRKTHVAMTAFEVFSATVIVSFCAATVFDNGTAEQPCRENIQGPHCYIFRHPNFMSFMVLTKWCHFILNLLGVRTVGENIMPAIHATTEPESICFCVVLILIVCGSFHAYYVFPIDENIGHGEDRLNKFLSTFLKIFRLEVLGDFDLNELEGVDQKVQGNINLTNGHGVLHGDLQAGENSMAYHRGIRGEFVVLSICVTIVFMNVYIGVLSSLYDKGKARCRQLYFWMLADLSYTLTLKAVACDCICGRRAAQGVMPCESGPRVWLVYDRCGISDDPEKMFEGGQDAMHHSDRQ